MPKATVTSKGQITIPKGVRETLDLQPGDQVDFVVAEGGMVTLRRASIPIEQLSGILKQPGRKAVSVDEMNQVIRRRGGRRQSLANDPAFRLL